MPHFAASVYVACLLTSVACAALLSRSYLRTGSRLLLWSAACFVLLSVNNALLVADLLLLPRVDLSLYRLIAAFLGVSCLLYGFIWEDRRE